MRLLLCVLAGMATLARAADLPRSDPASVGLDPNRLAAALGQAAILDLAWRFASTRGWPRSSAA